MSVDARYRELMQQLLSEIADLVGREKVLDEIVIHLTNQQLADVLSALLKEWRDL